MDSKQLSVARNGETEGVEKEKPFRLVYKHLDVTASSVRTMSGHVPCGVSPSTRRNVGGDETRLEDGTAQAKEGREYLSEESGFYSTCSNGGRAG